MCKARQVIAARLVIVNSAPKVLYSQGKSDASAHTTHTHTGWRQKVKRKKSNTIILLFLFYLKKLQRTHRNKGMSSHTRARDVTQLSERGRRRFDNPYWKRRRHIDKARVGWLKIRNQAKIESRVFFSRSYYNADWRRGSGWHRQQGRCSTLLGLTAWRISTFGTKRVTAHRLPQNATDAFGSDTAFHFQLANLWQLGVQKGLFSFLSRGNSTDNVWFGAF